jgi:predicted ATPase
VTLVDSPPQPSPPLSRDLQRIWTESVSLGGTRGPIPFQSHRPTGRRRPLGARGEGTVDWLAREPALFGAVRDWLAARLAPSRLDLDDSRDLMELYERDGPARISIQAAAEGVHQLLPVVTLLCARAQQSGPWLDLIEQPELHLHDALHGDLGDLLLAAAGLGQARAVDDGRRLVVETHSEGLLLRIRRRLAEGRVSPDQISLAYVDRSESGSTLRPIALDADGQPDWWPAGVFLERLEEVRAISRALRQRGGA